MSLPKQLPPQPTPGFRNLAPIRESSPIPAITSGASAPTRSQIFAISFANPIFIARNAFAAYLIISALVSDVVSSGTEISDEGRGTPGGGFKVGEIGLPSRQRRRTDCDEDHVAGADRVAKLGCERDAAALGRQRKHGFEVRLVDRRLALAQAGDFCRVGIDAGDVMTQV